MKKTFQNRLQAIDWIADYAKDEGQFEVLREQLNFNYIYTNQYFLDLKKASGEIVMFDNKTRK